MATTVSADLVERIRDRLIDSGKPPNPAHVAAALRDEGVLLGEAALLSTVSALGAELRGAGPLDALLTQPGVTDVLVNGSREVWIDTGAGLELTDIVFRDERAVRMLAQRLAANVGRRLDDACPYVDARLRDGTRLHAVLAPVSPDGTCLSLRIPRREAFTLAELRNVGTFDEVGEQWLRSLVESRASFVVSGGTGSGKTTLLSSLLSLVDPHQRIVMVEDSGELLPTHRHVVRLESRPPNQEGVGAITLRDLVRQALRMRPDRLVIGEVRGAEVVDLLAALNTGHEGGCGTVHANSADDVPARLEALALAAGLGRDALHAQVAAGLDAVVHLRRSRDGTRRLESIAALSRHENEVRCVTAVEWIDGVIHRGPAADRLSILWGVNAP